MDGLYKQTKLAHETGALHYWPRSALDDFAGDFEEVSIGWEDEEAASGLRNMIVQQNARLKIAKERLRQLIKENFSIEEVLFQSDSHPYR